MAARSLPACGEPILIAEILKTMAIDSVMLEGKSVRVTGRLDQHDIQNGTAVLADPRNGKSLVIDTTLVEPFSAKVGSMFQFIGELDCLSDNFDLTLKARVVRCVDSLDLVMYEKALEVQRKYLNQRAAKQTNPS